MYPAKHVSISIQRAPKDIYDFASNPQNLPRWAAGLSGAQIHQSGDFWICESPMGTVKVNFAERNTLGVMDHDVTLPSGEVNHNPFRVLANGSGGEVVFTLYKRPGVSEQDFQNDAAMICKDLETLKKLLEK